MAISSLATNAYQNAARLSQSTGGMEARAGKSSFGDALAAAIENLGQTTKNSDKQAQSMVAGKADLIDVVTAVAETEVAVESLVAVRDKVIQAYDEIMRMPI